MDANEITLIASLARVLSGLGLITVLLTLLKRYYDRRRWRMFSIHLTVWLDEIVEAAEDHQGFRKSVRDFTDHDWQAKCEMALTDAGYSPFETGELMKTAVVVAKRLAADRFFA